MRARPSACPGAYAEVNVEVRVQGHAGVNVRELAWSLKLCFCRQRAIFECCSGGIDLVPVVNAVS